MSLLDQIDSDILDVFISTNDFAIDAIYNSTTISVIFDDEYTGTNLGTGQIDTADPQVRVKSTDVTGISNNDTIVISDVTYCVKSIQPDGTGITILQLSKKALNNG